MEQFKDQVLETLEHDTKVVILRMRLVPALDATLSLIHICAPCLF